MYQKYKLLHNIIVKIRQKLIDKFFNSNNMFDDNDMQQNSFKKNEFKIYHRQNKVSNYVLIFVLIVCVYSIFCAFEKKSILKQ